MPKNLNEIIFKTDLRDDVAGKSTASSKDFEFNILRIHARNCDNDLKKALPIIVCSSLPHHHRLSSVPLPLF